jgi:hypothetical protein
MALFSPWGRAPCGRVRFVVGMVGKGGKLKRERFFHRRYNKASDINEGIIPFGEGFKGRIE